MDYLTQDKFPQNQNHDLPNATASLVLGIISIVGSCCYGLPGLICGIIGLVLANKDRSSYKETPELYSKASFNTSNAGRVCSIIGLILGALFLLFIVLAAVWNFSRSVQMF